MSKKDKKYKAADKASKLYLEELLTQRLEFTKGSMDVGNDFYFRNVLGITLNVYFNLTSFTVKAVGDEKSSKLVCPFEDFVHSYGPLTYLKGIITETITDVMAKTLGFIE